MRGFRLGARVFAYCWCVTAISAATIDFEAQGPNAPSTFTGTLNSPLIIGIATFTGGQLLKNEVNTGPDTTVVYATTGNLPLYTDPIVVTFAQPVDNVGLLVTNLAPDIYTLADNKGNFITSAQLNAGDSSMLNLTDSGVTRLTISSAVLFGWTFAIDNVTYTPSTTVVPEPPTAILLAGLLLSSVMLRKPNRGGSQPRA